ncbi:hypothetical protein MKJ01_15130 [Chryseobacterium sp. SSA4.19]|uniref:hypothetical protein n=1 Tax=Chryseobacterium sp. SSA4.19 TaxID=2919915 RepID=UPI001F4D3749|nr:hypothetical protein [Chryseobacterium sp. SSA4.19]MCJ8155100.1 hypothetical protein [Chryseobacterium sp. SSA4.19]
MMLFLFFPLSSFFSQAKNTSDGKEFIYNVSIGAITGAVGAIINKKKDQKLGEIAFKGFYQGAVGGYLSFESKRLVRLSEKENDWKLMWAAKLVNASGTSIKENAALNKAFGESWHINIGFNRIEFITKDRFHVKYKIMPIALIYTIGVAAQSKSKFELTKSLQNGQVIFSNTSALFDQNNTVAATYPGVIVYKFSEDKNQQLIPHEVIHIFQANDFSVTESFLYKPLARLESKSKALNTISKYVHFDFRYVPFFILNNLEFNSSTYYYQNFFEREAGFYSNTFDKNLLK